MNIAQTKQKFGSVELFIFTYASTITFGLIFLPYMFGEEIRSGWLKVIIAVIPFIFVFYLIQLVINKFNHHDVLNMFRLNTSKLIYIPIFFYLLCSSLVACLLGVKSLVIIVQTFLLHNTPEWTIVSYFLVIVLLSILYGINPIARVIQLFFILDILIILSVSLQREIKLDNF